MIRLVIKKFSIFIFSVIPKGIQKRILQSHARSPRKKGRINFYLERFVNHVNREVEKKICRPIVGLKIHMENSFLYLNTFSITSPTKM
jgi:hypothetical protein